MVQIKVVHEDSDGDFEEKFNQSLKILSKHNILRISYSTHVILDLHGNMRNCYIGFIEYE